MNELNEKIWDAIKDVDLGTASARKSGRNSRFPYVPIVKLAGVDSIGQGTAQTRQLLGKAFANREQAVEYAQMHLDALRDDLAERLAIPRHRALREQYGLPRDLVPAEPLCGRYEV